jgi:ATP-dependent Clp protease ATP-binding subunit ClpB
MTMFKHLGNLREALASRVVGQPKAVEQIVPYVETFQAGLAPEGRPAGVFLLLGPSGTGKTRTVEALAEVLHGNERSLVKIDCGEYQMDHEVAKLIGAPPGYLGHRETRPVLTQQSLNDAASKDCGLSLVLFDEIEKAAPSLSRLLLGLLDKGTLRLGDNSTVNFEHSLIFLTSNLGSAEMLSALRPEFGFAAGDAPASAGLGRQLESIGLRALRKRFSPEFVNRIDSVITYQPLGEKAMGEILDLQIADLERHMRRRLAEPAFHIDLTRGSRRFLLREGVSAQYGARELKRTIQRRLMQPLASMIARGVLDPGSSVRVEVATSGERLDIEGVRAMAA